MSETAVRESAVSIKGYVFEIFSGIQGEGLYVGERQIFVRLAGCDLHCAYCDTPSARDRTNICCVEQTPGRRDFVAAPNPMTSSEAIAFASALETRQGLHHSVALTGGEPLAQSKFAANVGRGLRERGFKIFLETNGENPSKLADVLPYLDIVSMDLKLPSSTSGPDLTAQHEAFLRMCLGKDIYAKVVLTSKTSTEELLHAAKLVQSVDADIPFVLQPVTPHAGVLPPSEARILDWQAECSGLLRSVRVIPQCHKIMGLM